ncbi:RagB/SusD family nutrient uptake outer membrane protein [Spirosoma endbachense]|uniref:RagB/SusD family nutrient uptake outer membrane protein n=1 Tax=Spirosoma endbachense TaxID=2666025 RepID=A0A6P1W505_9BACT|nr:RagB/SusD family nutrient uptake outer membrane protein [Spirosoma endbachense]QHV99964.1 RagB/SusD family nutrient uptake outer membrane protein [Spirosoma endbachense]
MKLSNKLLVAFCSSLLLTSCMDVLDKTDLGSTQGALIFKDSMLTQMNLDFIYDQNLPAPIGSLGPEPLGISGLSDESYGESKLLQGTVLVNDVTDFGTALKADNNYGKIRVINMFLNDVKAGPLPQYTKNKLRAQAQFFRAWRYFDLVRLYGGVPLVLTPLAAVGVEAKQLDFLPRNTTAETFAQIVKDLDSTIASVPGRWSASNDWGRVTKGTAAALKGRALLYAASPQFNPTDDQARWQAAYDANKQAYDLLTANGYGLHASFDQLWFQEVNNPEAVFLTGYNTATGTQTAKSNGYDNSTRPSYAGTAGGSNQPSWEMVKAFPMLDGKKPGESTKYTYSEQLFYKNRDPRFDKTIAYNGANWPLNGNTAYKVWTYYVGGKTIESKASNTGFYTRKAINPSVSTGDAQYTGTDWIEIRFAEVLLNLAESAVGINKPDEAYTQLKAVRKRAGIEAGTDGLYGLKANMSRAELFDAILYERQIEFAFEGKRFWDLRRWKLIEKTLNGTRRTGVTINLKTTGVPADFATNRDNVNLDVAYTNYFTLAFKQLDTKYSIAWKPEYYFFAIPQSAIDNNPKLIQNTTWGGAFDPLK